MSSLLVDIGNTRVKWAVLRGTRLGRIHAIAHGAGDAAHIGALVRAAPKDVDRVVAVNVAPESLARELTRALRARFGLSPEFVSSTRRAFGVVNGYKEVWRLGADRWVSVIGARSMAPDRAVIIANVGTALTVDLLTADGRHRGGAIVPGPSTMVESLLRGTHGIRRRAQGVRARERRLFAADTASALASGSVFAAAAFIDRAVAEATTPDDAPLLMLTGGGATRIRPLLLSAAEVMPDLVLRGLACFAADA